MVKIGISFTYLNATNRGRRHNERKKEKVASIVQNWNLNRWIIKALTAKLTRHSLPYQLMPSVPVGRWAELGSWADYSVPRGLPALPVGLFDLPLGQFDLPMGLAVLPVGPWAPPVTTAPLLSASPPHSVPPPTPPPSQRMHRCSYWIKIDLKCSVFTFRNPFVGFDASWRNRAERRLRRSQREQRQSWRNKWA